MHLNNWYVQYLAQMYSHSRAFGDWHRYVLDNMIVASSKTAADKERPILGRRSNAIVALFDCLLERQYKRIADTKPKYKQRCGIDFYCFLVEPHKTQIGPRALGLVSRHLNCGQRDRCQERACNRTDYLSQQSSKIRFLLNVNIFEQQCRTLK